jgi:hypothetical protein
VIDCFSNFKNPTQAPFPAFDIEMNIPRELDFNRKVDQDSYTNEMPEYPARVLTGHIALKGLQAGGIVGLVLTPVVSVMRLVVFNCVT